MARVYEPAWVRLKKNPSEPLVISADPRLHRRIYKAIAKEKNIDNLYHLELDMEGKTSILSKVSEGNALKITLTLKYKLEGIF
jgi:hypothetical protein